MIKYETVLLSMMIFLLSLLLNLKYLKYFKFNILTSGWFIILVYWKSGAISTLLSLVDKVPGFLQSKCDASFQN